MEKIKETQKAMILSAMERGRAITPMIAFLEFGCLNLSARICELQVEGYKVCREWVKIPTTGKRVMSYRLA